MYVCVCVLLLDLELLYPPLIDYSNMKHVAARLIIIQAITNHKGIRNRKPHIIGLKPTRTVRPLLHQRRHTHTGRVSILMNKRHQIRHRQARVDQIFHEQEVSALEVIEVRARNLDLASAFCAFVCFFLCVCMCVCERECMCVCLPKKKRWWGLFATYT